MPCMQTVHLSVGRFGASCRVKAHYGSVDGCYFITNPLFVPPHPSALLTQIVCNLGEDRQKRPNSLGNCWGWNSFLGPQREELRGTVSTFPMNCMFELKLQV